jgi:hypothetical protein
MFRTFVRPLPCVRLSRLHCADPLPSSARPLTERLARRRFAVAGLRRSCAVKASDRDTPGGGSTSGDGEDSDDGVSFVPRRKARAKGKVQPKVKVVTPTVDAALDEPPTQAGQAETAALLSLSAVFAAILVEGLTVASAGFMSDDMDTWVQVRPLCSLEVNDAHRFFWCCFQATILPLFTPTLLLFLLGSSSYGAPDCCSPRRPGPD